MQDPISTFVILAVFDSEAVCVYLTCPVTTVETWSQRLDGFRVQHRAAERCRPTNFVFIVELWCGAGADREEDNVVLERIRRCCLAVECETVCADRRSQ